MDTQVCSPCQFRGLCSRTKMFCKTCREALCEECADVHKSSRATRNHFLVRDNDIAVISATGSAMENMQSCIDHQKELEFFCLTHGHLLCSVCILQGNNKTCTNVKEITAASKALANSNFIDKVNADLQSVGDKLERDKTIIALQNNLTENKESNIKAWINAVRSNINNILDKFENDILSKVKEDCRNEGEQLHDLLQKNTEHIKQINDMQRVIESVIQNGSEPDLFRCVLVVGKSLDEYQENVDGNELTTVFRNYSLTLSLALGSLMTGLEPVAKLKERQDKFHLSKCAQFQSSIEEFLKIAEITCKDTDGTDDELD